jgi:hypothetical protein
MARHRGKLSGEEDGEIVDVRSRWDKVKSMRTPNEI